MREEFELYHVDSGEPLKVFSKGHCQGQMSLVTVCRMD